MISLFKVHMPKNLEILQTTLKSGFVAEGPKVKEFEQKIEKFVGNSQLIALNSGTSALHLALVLSNVKVGDMVITTPLTSPATNVSIVNLGAKIIWADIDPDTVNISQQSVKKLIDKYGDKVKAVICVDWGGYPCDIDELRRVIPENIKLIEDAAHALGGIYKSKLVGSLNADFTTFSFQAIKHITTGDGGLISIKNPDDYERGKRLKWFGIDRNKPGRTWNDDLLEVGYKFHMNDIAASLGIHQLDELDEILKKRRDNTQKYIQNINNLKYQFSDKYDANSACWLFTIFIDHLKEFMKYMEKNGIASFPVHIRNDFYTGFKNSVYTSDELNGVEEVSKKMCCIPVGEWLTIDEVDFIIEKINQFLG